MKRSDDQFGRFEKSYSMKDDGYVTRVTWQNAPNCWTYAATSVLESYLLKRKMIQIDQLLSPQHMTYAMFDMKQEAEYKNVNGKIPARVSEQDVASDYGGGRALAAAYLTRGQGGVSRETDPVVPMNPDRSFPPRYYDITTGKANSFLVTSMEYHAGLSGAQATKYYLEWIKDCLLDNSAVGFAYNDDRAYFSQEHNSSFCKTSGTKAGHHAAIIGWDDDFSKDKFVNTPSQNGAFLVKDSFYRYKGYDGYMWISYEDRSISDLYAVTGVDGEFYRKPHEILHHDIFGFQAKYVDTSSEDHVFYSCKYDSQEGDLLEGIGGYVTSPCVVTAECIVEGKTTVIRGEVQFDIAGYYTLYADQPIALKGQNFEIKVTLNAITDGPPVYPAVEYISSESYANIRQHIARGQCFIEDKDIVDIRAEDEKLGNIPLRAIVLHDSVQARNTAEAYDKVTLPAPVGNRLEDLPQSCQNVPVSWRLEPYRLTDYFPAAGPKIKMRMYHFKQDGKDKIGIINIDVTDAQSKVNLCACIGEGSCLLKKECSAMLGRSAVEFNFTVSEVKDRDNRIKISGENSEFRYMRVKASANGYTDYAEIGSDGKWQIATFFLYSLESEWKDDYKKTVLTLSIVDWDNQEFCTATKEFTLSEPYKVSDGMIWVYTVVGLIMVAIAGAAAYKCCVPKEITELDLGSIPADKMPPLEMGEMEAEGSCTLKNFFLKKVRSLKNFICCNRKIDQSNTVDEDMSGAFIQEVEDGGQIVNCRFSGSCSSDHTLGAIFGKGKNVTIENCEVELDVEQSGGAYCGIGAQMEGTCTVKNTKVSGNVQSGTFFAVAKSYENIVCSDLEVSVNVNAPKV